MSEMIKQKQWQYFREWKDGEFYFTGAWCYRSGDRVLLVDSLHGGTMVLTPALAGLIETRQPGDDLRFKLIARGFAATKGSCQIISYENCSPRPTFVMLDLTSKCNFQCEYCLREIEGDYESISEEQLEKNLAFLIDYAKTYRLPGLTIQPWGGEPMLELDKILYIRERFDAAHVPLNLTMETNGSLVTKRAAEKLKQAGVKVGISIDGFEGIHNFYRHLRGGQDTFQLAMEGIRNLRAAGYTTLGGIGVVTKRTLEKLENVLRFYLHDAKFTGFKLTIMHSPANSALCADMLDEQEIQEYANRLIDFLCDCYRKDISIAESSISNRMANLIYRNNQNICVSNGCRGGRRLISIDKHGKIYLCELMDMPEQMIGTTDGSESIPDMLERAVLTMPYFKEKEIEDCKTCPWRYYCRGGCTGIVLYEKGCVEGVDPISCSFNRVVYQRLAEILLEDPELALKFL